MGKSDWFDSELMEVSSRASSSLAQQSLSRVSTELCWAHNPVNVRACSSAVPVLLGTPDPRGHRSAQRYLQQEPRMSVERPGSGQMWAGARVGKDLSPAAPLPYVDRRGVARIGCAAVARV